MNKLKLLAVFLGVMLVSGAIYAAVTSFTETLPPQSTNGAVPTSNGYSWSLSTNAQNSAPPLALPAYSLAYATSTLVAATTGQLIVVTSGASTNPVLCISSGSTTTNQFVAISTGGLSAAALTACH